MLYCCCSSVIKRCKRSILIDKKLSQAMNIIHCLIMMDIKLSQPYSLKEWWADYLIKALLTFWCRHLQSPANDRQIASRHANI